MKKIILTSLVAMAISTTAFSTQLNDSAGTQVISLLTSTGLVPAIASAYNPSLGGILAAGTAVAFTQIDKMKTKQLQYAVNTDIEEYRATGDLSVALKQIVDQIKEENSQLSESEAVDIIGNQIESL